MDCYSYVLTIVDYARGYKIIKPAKKPTKKASLVYFFNLDELTKLFY